MSLDSYETNDPGFLKDLDDSAEAVHLTVKIIQKKGFDVVFKAMKKRPDVNRMSEYSDSSDLAVQVPVEVKQRKNLTFTSRETYPYPTVFVDVAHKWDDPLCRPSSVYIYNRELTHYILIRGNTINQWKQTRRMDKQKGRERTFLECPVELCEFHSVADALND